MSRLACVIEDDASLQEIYSLVLKSAGFNVLRAGDGQTALEILENNQPEIIFLDVRLPVVNGLDVLQYIDEAAHLNMSQVVVVSAENHLEQLTRQYPRAHFHLKPMLPTDILSIISD
jgi:DNA-binding response OmpR family regulator